MLLRNIKKQLMAQDDPTIKAYMGLRNMMFKKEIVPGQKIPSRELSKRLDLSLTPVIQALKWMEFQGLVHREPNRGYFAEPINLKEVEEIYELRELLEPALLNESFKRLNKKRIDQLEAALEAHLNAPREIYLNERIIRDMEYHLTLASLSGKTIQERILQNIFDVLCLKYRGNFASATSLQMTDIEHRGIFEAIAHRQLDRAKEILLQHISNAKKQVLISLKQMLDEESASFY